ncbi:unnamed protein product [Rotaria magnacalcarata]|uniref:Uncharacterized protein n=1 Tax=Rotaria magnacalcarata TaxID=392030 RepID=A0A820I3X7_9BILA|nr:unnamed protein product [Rotaria magnacalcarata]
MTELSWIKPSGEDLIEMRGKLYKEITTNAPKYGVDLNGKNKLVWKEYKASQTFVPMEFVQAFCKMYKYEAHVYFSDLRPFVIKPFKDNRNGVTEVIYLYLKGNNHYNLLSLDPKSDFEMLEGCNYAFNDITYKDKEVGKTNIIKNINIENTEEINLCDLGSNRDTTTKYNARVPYVRKTVDCSHLCPSNAILTVSEVQFGDSEKVYCCLLDTGSSINVLAHSVAYELKEQGLLTHVREENTRISGTGDAQITEMGILDNDPNYKIVNKINYNNPADYLTYRLDMKTLPTLNEGIEVVEGFAEDFEVNEMLGEILEKEAKGESLCPEELHLRDLASDPANNNTQPEIISSKLIINNCINSTPHCYVDNNKLIVLNDFKRNIKSGFDNKGNNG